MTNATLTTILTPLALLACPVGMGLMMWMMGRGNRQQQPYPNRLPSKPESLELLREEQRRLGEEIDRLEKRKPNRHATSDRR